MRNINALVIPFIALFMSLAALNEVKKDDIQYKKMVGMVKPPKEGLKKKISTGCYMYESDRNAAYNTAHQQIAQTAFAVTKDEKTETLGAPPGGDGYLYCYTIEYWI